jgi:predicted RNA-binding Zn-ribbon protein involved in translation (DUF1610 family)
MTTMAPQPEDPKAVYGTCPRCGEKTLRVDRPAMNALSRTDNKTYVCSDCGTNEALEDFIRGMSRHSKDAWKSPQSATLLMSDD